MAQAAGEPTNVVRLRLRLPPERPAMPITPEALILAEILAVLSPRQHRAVVDRLDTLWEKNPRSDAAWQATCFADRTLREFR